jgi:DNA-binding MltR family transcriptional regulator
MLVQKYEINTEKLDDFQEDIKALFEAMEEDEYKLAKKLIAHLRDFHHLSKEYVYAKLKMMRMMKELHNVQKEKLL